MILNRITKYNAPLSRKEFSTWRGLKKDLQFGADKKTTANLLSQDGVTFTRATPAYNDTYGSVVAIASGEPVYDYSASLGMRIEKGTTNTVRNTDCDESSSSGWIASAASFPGSNTTGPDGVAGSGKQFQGGTSSSSSNYHLFYEAGIVDGSGALKNGWSASVYVKAGNANFFGMAFCNNARIGATFCVEDYSAAVFGSDNCTASITSVGNGWYLCKCENLTNVVQYGVFAITVGSTGALTWGGGSGELGAWRQRSDYPDSTANYCYIFGPQIENSTFCTSYMANLSDVEAGIARAADVCTITGSNFSSFYNASEGTFAVEGRRLHAGSSALPTLMEVNDGGTSDTIGFNTSATKEQFDIYGPSGAATIETVNDIAKHVTIKIAGGYKATKYAASGSGATTAVNTLAAVPTVNQLAVGKSAHGRELNGYVKRIRYYNRRLTDKQIKTLST